MPNQDRRPTEDQMIAALISESAQLIGNLVDRSGQADPEMKGRVPITFDANLTLLLGLIAQRLGAIEGLLRDQTRFTHQSKLTI